MADIEYYDDRYESADRFARAPHDPEADIAPRSALGLLVSWAGALISLGLVIGMGVWATQLMMRDVTGVPVIQALEGPMRIAPEDPGGTQALNQGLAVNRIAEGEEAQPVPDRLVLAPPPVELQDLSFGASRPEEAAETRVAATAGETAPEATPEAVSVSTSDLIDRLLREAELGEPSATARASQPEPGRGPDVVPASVPGVAASLRPKSRPVSTVLRSQSSSTAATPPRAAPVEDLNVATLPDGTRLVQLGAFDTPDVARGAWTDLAQRFPDYFAGRPRVIEEATAGERRFFRLRAAGFADLEASRRFCAVLVAQGAACIPVTVR